MKLRVFVISLFIILFIIFILISYSFFFKNIFFKPNLQTPTTEKQTTQSAFKQTDLKRYEKNTSEMTRSLSLEDYWNNWSWDTKIVEAEIVSILPEYHEFIIRVYRPVDQSFTRLKQRVKIDCPISETIMVSSVNPTQSLYDGGFDIFEKAQKQDIFYGYCLDPDCLNIGTACVLVKRGLNETE